ncbi:deoxyribose-phosphate aldolase [Paenibacillus sp. CC-CFT747]|nr:deoxyribose-phosphate aldolase [Paenibacillus sp. CC-CFT747]
MEMNPIAGYIDHTLLKPDATSEAICKLCEEALEHRFYGVCVNSQWVSYCKEILGDSGVKISAVVGFPLGANHSGVKAFEAQLAIANGADEIDMVLPVGLVLEGNYDEVERDIRHVVEGTFRKNVIKVILETGFLNDEQKIEACRAAERAGAHFVKTSTGFGPGKATIEDVRLMRDTVSEEMSVKASGGIKDLETALRMIEAGASRLGTSSGVAIVSGVKGIGEY